MWQVDRGGVTLSVTHPGLNFAPEGGRRTGRGADGTAGLAGTTHDPGWVGVAPLGAGRIGQGTIALFVG